LVKGTDGIPSASYEYDPFGRTIRATGAMAKENPFRFSTKRADDAADLALYEYRSYNPSGGRWLNRDPLNDLGFKVWVGNRDGIQPDEEKNLYAFVHNDSVNRLDPFGLQSMIGVCPPGVYSTCMAGCVARGFGLGFPHCSLWCSSTRPYFRLVVVCFCI